MSYFKYVDNGNGPTKLFLGGIHGNEGKTSIKFIKSIKNEDLSCGQFYFYNFDKTQYISTLKKEFYESDLGQKILDLIIPGYGKIKLKIFILLFIIFYFIQYVHFFLENSAYDMLEV